MDPIEAYQREHAEHAQQLNKMAADIAARMLQKESTSSRFAKAADLIAQLPKDHQRAAREFFSNRIAALEAF